MSEEIVKVKEEPKVKVKEEKKEEVISGKVAFIKEGVTIIRDISNRLELEKSGWIIKK